MGNYNIGEVWWTEFPFEDQNIDKRRPAIVIDDDTIAVLTMMVTSKEKKHPFCIKIDDWKDAGLSIESWARIDRIVKMEEWRMYSKIGDLSRRDLLKFMQLIVELTNETFHEFSLLAICNTEGKYLQVFDERWKCWLFPYFRSSDQNKENVDNCTSEMLKMQVCTSYVTYSKHCKYSVSDGVYKIYAHKLYKLSLEKLPEYLQADSFELDGKKYAWMSIRELEATPDIMDKNDDIIAFVKAYC